jgi:hypothetical protein
MASRRTVITRDRQRNCSARKRTVRANRERQVQQADVLRKLISQAKVEAKAAAAAA